MATCPSCHVVVLPGYTKCPKCHGALPYAMAKRAGTTADAGGTVAEERASMIVPVVVAVLVAGSIIAFFAWRAHGRADEAVVVAPMAQPVAPVAAPPPPVARPAPPPPTSTSARPPAGPSPTVAAAAFEKELRHQRLWATAELHADRIDVRSTTCADPAMAAAVEVARASLRAAGLTRLRCLEEGGRVVFERDL